MRPLAFALTLLLTACGAPSSLQPGEFSAGEQQVEGFTDAHLSIDEDAGVLTPAADGPVTITFSELPESEWREVGTYPFARAAARTYAVSPDPLVLPSGVTVGKPQLVAVNDGQQVVLFGEVPPGEAVEIWFQRDEGAGRP